MILWCDKHLSISRERSMENAGAWGSKVADSLVGQTAPTDDEGLNLSVHFEHRQVWVTAAAPAT